MPLRNADVVNQPELVRLALSERPGDFTKAALLRATLGDLRGDSVFVTGGCSECAGMAAAAAARAIRALLAGFVVRRAKKTVAGVAPPDLAMRIMTTTDPETGAAFGQEEALDQVMIFFLAGRETSASALARALWLLANDKEVQARAQAEIDAAGPPNFAALRRIPFTRDVFREALRLFPPAPMLLREPAPRERLRGREAPAGPFFILSPWHSQRRERLWRDPGLFDPHRWRREDESAPRRDAYIPFRAGPRTCPGAGFAMLEGVLSLAVLLSRSKVSSAESPGPRSVARLTVRSDCGTRLRLGRR